MEDLLDQAYEIVNLICDYRGGGKKTEEKEEKISFIPGLFLMLVAVSKDDQKSLRWC